MCAIFFTYELRKTFHFQLASHMNMNWSYFVVLSYFVWVCVWGCVKFAWLLIWFIVKVGGIMFMGCLLQQYVKPINYNYAPHRHRWLTDFQLPTIPNCANKNHVGIDWLDTYAEEPNTWGISLILMTQS